MYVLSFVNTDGSWAFYFMDSITNRCPQMQHHHCLLSKPMVKRLYSAWAFCCWLQFSEEGVTKKGHLSTNLRFWPRIFKTILQCCVQGHILFILRKSHCLMCIQWSAASLSISFFSILNSKQTKLWFTFLPGSCGSSVSLFKLACRGLKSLELSTIQISGDTKPPTSYKTGEML